ncbi:MAG: hypothetical protein N2Z73_03260 [Endomicrobia bacterium]|nr:hypothetical protein [Endomicrobiia bacterium]
MDQFNAIKRAFPKLKKIEVVYSANSADVIAEAREVAKNLGLELITQAIKNENEVVNAFLRLVDNKIEILWLTVDNIVLTSSNRKELLEKSKQNKIPVYGPTPVYLKGEIGATISVSPDYKEMGMEAGELALKLLNGNINVSIQSPKKYISFVKKNSQAKIYDNDIVVE